MLLVKSRLLQLLLPQRGPGVHFARALASCYTGVLPFQATQTCPLCRLLKKRLNRYKDKLQAIYNLPGRKKLQIWYKDSRTHNPSGQSVDQAAANGIGSIRYRMWETLAIWTVWRSDLESLGWEWAAAWGSCPSLWSASSLSHISLYPNQLPLSSARRYLPLLWRWYHWERTAWVPFTNSRLGAKRYFIALILKPLVSAPLLESYNFLRVPESFCGLYLLLFTLIKIKTDKWL